MYHFPLSPSTTCPHCKRKLGLTRRLVPCALSGEIVCTRCIVGGRFSDAVWDGVPKEYRQKFRVADWLLFFGVAALAVWLMQSGVWTSGMFTRDGWDLGNLLTSLINLGIALGLAGTGIGVLVGTTRLPPLSSWLFHRWIAVPANKQRVQDAVSAQAAGTYRPASTMFTRKVAFFSWLSASKFRVPLFASMVANVATIPLFYIVRYTPGLAGTVASWLAGLVELVAITSTLVSATIAAGHYCSKKRENAGQKAIIELLSFGYVIALPLWIFSQTLAVVASVDHFRELPSSLAGPMFTLHLVMVNVFPGIGAALNAFLLFGATPHARQQGTVVASRGKGDAARLAGANIALFILIGILLVLLGLALLITITDAAMAISMLSSGPLLFGVTIPVTFAILKLARRGNPRYNQPYNTLIRVSVIVIAINALPLVGTLVATNPSVDAEFATAFGPDWQAQIDPARAALMRQVPFSFFDFVHGFDIPSNARYTIEYCQDSPRYVKNGSVVVSNGTSKYTEIVDTFVFDAYLPQDIGFGDGDPRKLPVIIFMHGIGMDFGTGNANWTSQYLANQGYLVCDLEYGFIRWRQTSDAGKPNSSRSHRNGYDFPDTIFHVANFTHFLHNNSAFYHADMSQVYLAGRSFGGWMATAIAYGYHQIPAHLLDAQFAPGMNVAGCINFYGATGIAASGDGNFILGSDPPYFRGSSVHGSPAFNPMWEYLDPFTTASTAFNGGIDLCPTIHFQGSNDVYLILPDWTRRLDAMLKAGGHVSIPAYYPLGSHGNDAIFWLQHGQSILYYLERFLALTG